MSFGTKHFARFTIISGLILCIISIILLEDVTQITEGKGDLKSHVNVYVKMAHIAFAELGLFIGILQVIISVLLVFSGKTGFEALEKIWIGWNIVCFFVLITCFAFSLGWEINSNGKGKLFCTILALDSCLVVGLIISWFHDEDKTH